MSTPFRLIVIGTAVAAALLGGSMLAGGGGPAMPPPPAPIPTPTPTRAATATPSPSAAYPSWFSHGGNGAGILAAGRQATQRFIPGSTFIVPEGWVNEDDTVPVYSLFPDTPANEAEYADSKETAQNIVLTDRVANNMFAICDATGLFQGATAAETTSAVVANPAFKFWATEPIDVTIGGLTGRQVDLQLSPEWSGTCTHNPDDPTRDYLDARMRLIVLDSPGGDTIGIAISSHHSSGSEQFLGKAMPIIESLRFAVGQGASPSL